MDATYVGIDVSKDRLDVHVLPGGQAFVVRRDGAGLEELVERLRALAPTLIALEATGGFETIVERPHAGRVSEDGPQAQNLLQSFETSAIAPHKRA